MKKSITIILLIILFIAQDANAQAIESKLHALTDPITNCEIRYYYYFNIEAYYDTKKNIYFYKEKLKVSTRLGFAPAPNGRYFEQIYIVENNFILFKNPHHLELGLGVTMQRRYNERPNLPDNYFWENIWFSIWRCGYRFQRQDDGFFVRAGLTPAIMSKDAEGFHSNYFQFWAGVSVGVSF